MTNVSLIPNGEHPHAARHDDHHKRQAGGAICPLCKASADARIFPHLCITGAYTVDQIIQRLPDIDHIGLFHQLANHPARPWNTVDTRTRPVPGTWCFCAHQPPGTSRVGPGQARS